MMCILFLFGFLAQPKDFFSNEQFNATFSLNPRMWSVAVLTREVPWCFRLWTHVVSFAAALAYGRKRKTKVMSAPFKSFLDVWIAPSFFSLLLL